jgi:hypothetical protein
MAGLEAYTEAGSWDKLLLPPGQHKTLQLEKH